MVDEKTKNRWKKEDAVKKENEKVSNFWKDIMEKKFAEVSSGQMSVPSDYLYGSPSGSAYPSEPILTSKVSGWIGVFGDHYLCEAGCKKYVSKKLDDVIKFFEREIRLWYKAKELAKKGKLDVEVKGHVRKPRAKKQETKDENEPSI